MKNLFALANAIVSISGRSAVGKEELLQMIQARLSSLARAHELTMANWQKERTDTQTISLHALFGTILEPYGARERVAVVGANPTLGSRMMTHIALLLHELATNAAKYGSLSVADGHLILDVRESHDRICLIWSETGGPAPSLGEHPGFGSQLEKGLASALNATIAREWEPTGLVASIEIPITMFAN